jgi:hypothetical protein
MIPDTSDKDGHSLKMLLQFAIKHFPPDTVYDFVTNKDHLVGAMAAQRLQMKPNLGERTFNYAVEMSRHKSAWHRELAGFILGQQLCPPDYPYKSRAVPIFRSCEIRIPPCAESLSLASDTCARRPRKL